MADDIARDLNIARDLVAAGVPVFVAQPCLPDCGSNKHKPGQGTGGSGFHLPLKWETTTTAGNQVDRWRPGWALCAVMGHAVDLVDVDPRNGGNETVAGLQAAGSWPRSYGRALTPSGGTHDFVAPLRVHSLDGVAPGLDIKSGAGDGGHGFAFIAPTVKRSKTTGELAAYQWLVEPTLPVDPDDDSGVALAEMVAGKRAGKTTTTADEFSWDEFKASPLADLAAFMASDRPRRQKVFEVACALRGRGGWRLGDVLAYMHAVAWPLVDQNQGGHEFPVEEFDENIRSAFAQYEDGHPDHGEEPPESPRSRRVDLRPYLNGTWTPPQPDRGVYRDDGARLLYAGRWHTCIGPTEAGKTWLGLVHARDELNAGNTVVWAHLEEFDPGGTVARLLALGVPAAVILERFVWLDCDRAWTAEEFAAELIGLHRLTLVGLDGINAACTRHNQDPKDVAAVGWYRRTFVTPAVRLGAAALSLGHPVKDPTRRDERHGFGSSAWLDEADGVGFRLLPGKSPIRRGQSGTASLYVVKDRYGEVGRLGTPDSREGWTYLGALVVDDTRGDGTVHARLSTPDRTDTGQPTEEPLDRLVAAIVEALRPDGDRVRFDSERQLQATLRAAGLKFRSADLSAALAVLKKADRLERDGHGGHGGWVLTASREEE
jgi:hypothetical protein